MNGIQAGINSIGNWVSGHMADGPLHDLVKDGIFAGVGTVVVFVPQIAMLFLFLAILEDTGYLARAAFLMDRLLSKVGLHGKSFIPLLSSFACAIPGIMATRTIENRRERLATILVAPFMSCSARLPVYTLLIGAFFATLGPFKQAGIMLACYALGIVAAAGTAFVFKRTLTKGPATSFILELPSYKIPQVSQVVRQMWINTKAFLAKAGTTIFCLSVILWAMAYYPRLPDRRVSTIRIEARPRAENIVRTQDGTWGPLVVHSRGLIGLPPLSHEQEQRVDRLVDNAVARSSIRVLDFGLPRPFDGTRLPTSGFRLENGHRTNQRLRCPRGLHQLDGNCL